MAFSRCSRSVGSTRILFSSVFSSPQRLGFVFRGFASSTDSEQQKNAQIPKTDNGDRSDQKDVLHKPNVKRRKATGPAKQSLARAAFAAEVSRERKAEKSSSTTSQVGKSVIAYCIAQEFNLSQVERILGELHYQIDPCKTDLEDHVIHIEVPLMPDHPQRHTGDFFIFPSGTVVAWDVPAATIKEIACHTLLPAAINAHVDKLETEDLSYNEDTARERSSIRDDMITLGTTVRGYPSSTTERRRTDTVLAKIAFSSGLARSTKLAVLESRLEEYLDSVRSIPPALSGPRRLSFFPLPFRRAFILQKIGELLNLRAQLNLYSEITDSVPDLFWDSEQELEGYYERIGRALDIGLRIQSLNKKMDYAQEIAGVLKDVLGEKHGTRLEWIIILLIAVEVVFGIDDRFDWKTWTWTWKGKNSRSGTAPSE